MIRNMVSKLLRQAAAWLHQVADRMDPMEGPVSRSTGFDRWPNKR